MEINRVWAMPSKHTFTVKPIKQLLDEECGDGIWVDPFSGENSVATITNDADESKDTDRHEDGLEFLKSFENESVDGVIFDPPYSVEQALRIYKPKHNGTAGRAEYWSKCKDEIARVLKPNGKSICFGWDSTGIGIKRKFLLKRVLLVCHGACHNDTIVTVEIKSLAPHNTK